MVPQPAANRPCRHGAHCGKLVHEPLHVQTAIHKRSQDLLRVRALALRQGGRARRMPIRHAFRPPVSPARPPRPAPARRLALPDAAARPVRAPHPRRYGPHEPAAASSHGDSVGALARLSVPSASRTPAARYAAIGQPAAEEPRVAPRAVHDGGLTRSQQRQVVAFHLYAMCQQRPRGQRAETPSR